VALTAERAAAAFVGAGAQCTPHAGGHINTSFLVRRDAHCFFLQRINRDVFPDPRGVMRNVAAVTTHVRSVDRAVTVPALLPTLDGRPWLEDETGDVWRCAEFVDGIARSNVGSADHAFEAAYAFGALARALASYEGPPLRETIPGFHDTAARVAQLEATMAVDPVGRLTTARHEVDELLGRRALASVLSSRLASGEIPTRLAHNDAKIANVLFDRATGRARWVVDLDTVMPGSLLHDFGDLVRSSASRAPEDAAANVAEAELFEGLAAGFLRGAGGMLAPAELELLETAGRLITYEQAVRFLVDHLQGDRYYRVTRPAQNLDRARAQLALLRSLEQQTAGFAAIVSRIARS